MRVLRFKELKAQKGISFCRVHLARLEQAGQFPKRVNLSTGTVAWVESEIDAWLDARIADRDAGKAA